MPKESVLYSLLGLDSTKFDEIHVDSEKLNEKKQKDKIVKAFEDEAAKLHISREDGSNPSQLKNV